MSKRLKAIIILLGAISAGGCAMKTPATPPSGNEATNARAQSVIARDFVHVLKQLGNWQPVQSTIDLLATDRKDSFTLAMRDELQRAGYGTRWVHSEASANLFAYRRSSEQGAASSLNNTYELEFGSVQMRRVYAIDVVQGVHPAGPHYIRGADAHSIVVDDDILVDENAENVDDDIAGRVNTTHGNTPKRETQGVQIPDKPMVNNDVSPLDSQVAQAIDQSMPSQPFANLLRPENVFEIGGSNFNSLFIQRRTVADKILMFADDSMRLGALNKQLVDTMVARFNPATDVFSVIGCSMGPTRIKGGNAALALGRAGRVVEALRFAGVDDRHILDEGCWSGNGKLQGLPARGVVLTLSRKE